MNFLRKALNIRKRCSDLVLNLPVRGERRIAQPVMADHTLLIGIGDCAVFEGCHCGECLVDKRLHGREI